MNLNQFLRRALLFCLLAAANTVFAQTSITSFSFEDKDWQIDSTARPKKAPYHGPTPTTVPGARVIKTLELKAMLDSNKNLVVIDVLDVRNRKSIPGALLLAGAGDGQFFGGEKSRFATALEKITVGDKDRPIVFLCLSSECWLSYNASLHAVEAGYKNIIWYRGGTNSWAGASFELTTPQNVSW